MQRVVVSSYKYKLTQENIFLEYSQHIHAHAYWKRRPSVQRLNALSVAVTV